MRACWLRSPHTLLAALSSTTLSPRLTWPAHPSLPPSLHLFLGCSIAMGLGEGVAFPAIHSTIARSVPAEQQATSVGIVTAASYAGTALAFGLAPTIIEELGWPVRGSLALPACPRCLPSCRREAGGAAPRALPTRWLSPPSPRPTSHPSTPLPACTLAVGVLHFRHLGRAVAALLAAAAHRRRQPAARQRRQVLQPA